MPDVWLPGAYIDEGANAHYNAGRNQMIRAVAHYTVGNDSRNTGRTGYCHWLVHKDASRENGCTQYAPIDAVTWHAANQGNPYGPGIEWERMTTGGQNDEGLSNADPLTDNQIEWGNRIVEFCQSWGIPGQLWDGDRYAPEVMPGGGWCGWVNHHDLDSQRTDGCTNDEWSAICGGGTQPDQPAEEDDDVLVCVCNQGRPDYHGLWIISDTWAYHNPSVNVLSGGRTMIATADEIQWFRDVTNQTREALGARPV